MALMSDPAIRDCSQTLKIEPTYPLHAAMPLCYLHAVQEIVEGILPKPLALDLQNSFGKSLESIFYQFSRSLPLIQYHLPETYPETVPVSLLFPAQYTHGCGRYVTDMLSRWLYPGKQMPIVGKIELNFRFAIFPSTSFFVTQELVSINTEDEFRMIRKNLASLIEEMKFNIMAVYQARYIASLSSASQSHKTLIFQENLSSILRKDEVVNRSLYDQMQSILAKSSSEKKVEEIKKNFTQLLTARPKTFDRDLFYEMMQYTSLFKDSLSLERRPRHVCRVIAYQYLFKKYLQTRIEKVPAERHISLKVFRASYSDDAKKVLAILFGFNFLKDHERFDVKHLFQAILGVIPEAKFLSDSIVVDRRDEKMRFFYLELSNDALSHREVKRLREKLPQEILRQIETPVPPVFMPRNDEELMRALIVLNKQIRYVRDLPQVSIHYEMQSESELIFTVVLVRLLKEGSSPLSSLLEKAAPPLKFETEEIRISGYLKNKIPKEAAILRTSLDKGPFFRPDHSVDILRARQKISAELASLFGEFRDFNGGIILKQDEALSDLRKELGPLSKAKEFLLENYFYSLRPAIMQTVYEASTLKAHFEQLLESIEFPLQTLTHRKFVDVQGKYLLCFIKAISPSFKEAILDELEDLRISSHNLSTVFLQIDQSSFLGIILRTEKPETAAAFEKKIEDSLTSWRKRLTNENRPLDVVV